MLKQTDAVAKELLKPITFILAYPTVFSFTRGRLILSA